MLRIVYIFLILIVLSACGTRSTSQSTVDTNDIRLDESITDAQRFSIWNGNGFKVIHLLAKASSIDTTDTFILYDSIQPNLNFKNQHFIKSPCERILALSSIYANMLTELGCLSNIIGIENIDYYNNESILTAFNNGKIKEVQRNPDIDRELVLKMRPDIVFAFGMNQTSNDFDSKIIEAGIPAVMCLDHLEKTPLARAEWIKFYAAFVNKSEEANIIFSEVKKDYQYLESIAHTYTDIPSVLTELKFCDTWYVPGGKSFMARLIADANANYCWSKDTASGSLPLSFEAVYRTAKEADVWLNVSLCTNKEQMLSQDKRYAEFNAFKKNGVYNNNLHCNKLNYSTYWETGMIYPNKILSDMIQIFHAKAKDDLNRPFNYYKKLN